MSHLFTSTVKLKRHNNRTLERGFRALLGMRFLPAIAALLAVAVMFQSKAFSAGRSKRHSPTPAPEIADHITAIHLTSITINVYATQAAKEYKVTPATKITVNGQPSRLDGLATGMSVRVTSALDGATAVSVDAKSPKR